MFPNHPEFSEEGLLLLMMECSSHLSWRWKPTWAGGSHRDRCTPVRWQGEGTSPPSPQPVRSQGHPTPTEEDPARLAQLPSAPPNCQGHQKQSLPEKVSQPRGAWGAVMIQHLRGFWVGSWRGTEVLGKNWDGLDESCLQCW